MSVYVDESRYPYRRMIMCHMAADTLIELHTMAHKIGIKAKWFQKYKRPHYDICKSKRALAIKYGAIEVTTKELIQIIRNMKYE